MSEFTIVTTCYEIWIGFWSKKQTDNDVQVEEIFKNLPNDSKTLTPASSEVEVQDTGKSKKTVTLSLRKHNDFLLERKSLWSDR